MSKKIAVILPRGCHFSPNGATAIDLCVHDFVCHSQFKERITVIGHQVEQPFKDVNFIGVNGGRKSLNAMIAIAQKLSPDVIIVQQHVPSAVKIARTFPKIPIMLHKHAAYLKQKSFLRHKADSWRFSHFNEIIWVSDFARQSFCKFYPHYADKTATVWNGIDFGLYDGNEEKENKILFVGRANPEKGGREAAQAVADILTYYPDWCAQFILSAHDKNYDYLNEIITILETNRKQIEYATDIPFSKVIEAEETANIMLVPSVVAEAFGRTALEAFAAKSALICSIQGALPEVAGDCAEFLTQVNVSVIAKKLQKLIENPMLRNNLALAGYERANKLFSIAENVRKMDTLLAKYL